MSTARTVAASLVNLSYEKQSPISNLKLQKLLYYSQAWYLAFFAQPLFPEEIEAWVHGPVVPEIFRMYRDNKWADIPQPLHRIIPDEIRGHLEEVWRAYGNMSASDLERLTHSERPWQDVRAGIDSDVSCRAVITKESMRQYYFSRLNGQP
jgi:uncharacterized phage-associated protein